MENEELENLNVSVEDSIKIEDEIVALEKMNELSSVTTPAVAASKIESPTDRVEEKLSDFVTDVFKATNKDLEFNEKVKAEIVSRLGSFNDNQLIALFSNTNVNLNDKISKTIGPTFQLMTATKQAEIAEVGRQQNQQAAVNVNIGGNSNMKGTNESAPQEVIQGLDTLYKLISVMGQKDGKN